MTITRPPRLARALLERVIPADVRDAVTGDLEELFQRDRRDRGAIRARLRYWRIALSCARRFTLERARERRRWSLGFSFSFSRLDFTLGLRMLVRYPGLSLMGGLAMAFAIAVGAGAFEFTRQVLRPTLPLDEGERVVVIRLWHVAAHGVEEQALFDLGVWRNELDSVERLGVFRNVDRNLSVPDGRAWPVEVAEITASGFEVARVPALAGRFLREEDEQPGAPAVVVIGHGFWQNQLGADPGVIGRTVRLSGSPATIVGVMPDGFAFPVSHEIWAPFRLRSSDYGGRQGPEVVVFGRLAAGVSLAEAQAEISGIGARLTADFPDTHEHLRPQVLPFAESMPIVSLTPAEVTAALATLNVPILLLVVLICGNVALLIFARTTTRESELVVRSALGASRGRIVAQLFAEALVLSSVAAVVGLSVAGFGLRWGQRIVEAEVLEGGRLPFWFDDRLAPVTLLYAGLLTIVSAAIAGIVPALKITRRSLSHLPRQTPGTALGFGGVWTAVIVTQVAVTMAFPVVAFYVHRDGRQIRAVDVGFRSEEFLSARLELELEMERESPSGAASRADWLARYRRAHEELQLRLRAEPGVVGVTVMERLPRMYHERRFIELDEGGAEPPPAGFSWPAHGIGAAAIEIGTLDVLDSPVLQGRGFHSGDGADRRVVIVNTSFVARVLGGRNPIGRRVRFLRLDESGQLRVTDAVPGPWHEIVGVVRDMGMAHEPDPKVAGLYLPLPPDVYPLHVAVHVMGPPAEFAPRLRAIALGVDPTLRIDQVRPLDQVTAAELQFIDFWFTLAVIVSVVALGLALAGIYAVMSFTVSRRTREIGIRVALGARPRRVMTAVFRRPLMQVGAGIAGGVVLTMALNLPVNAGVLSVQIALTVGYALVMIAVCALACVVPARRAMRVEPVVALKNDG